MECQEVKFSYFDPITHRYIFDNRPNALLFVRGQGDLLVGDRISFVGITQDGFLDIQLNGNAEAALSAFFKRQLCINNTHEHDEVEISPLVSYDGHQRIEEIKNYLRTFPNIGYPLKI